MSTHRLLHSFASFFSSKVSSKINQSGRSGLKHAPKKLPCVKRASKEIIEVGWMKQPVVKNPPRFKVELASSDCKFLSFLGFQPEVITEQDIPSQLNVFQNTKAVEEKTKLLSPIDEFIRAALCKPSNAAKSITKNPLENSKCSSNFNREIFKFQYEQSRQFRTKFMEPSSLKCESTNPKGVSGSVLAKAASKIDRSDPRQVLLLLSAKEKITNCNRYFQTTSAERNEKKRTSEMTLKKYHRIPITSKINGWL